MSSKPFKIVQDPQKEMPCNIEAEQSLIGSILVLNDIYDEVSTIIDSNKFFDPVHVKIYEVIDCITLSFASALIAVMKQGKKDLIEIYKVPQERVKLIYNGIKLEKYESMASSEGTGSIHEPLVTIGMAAQFTSVKGWPDFLNTIKELKDQGKNIRGMLIGDGPERANMEKLAVDIGINDSVEFVGHINKVSDLNKAKKIFQ